ncbi:MAG TPA: anti-sigma factor [Lapillicoccus sp.]|nr:anti-sigma factor [Lapillicoccus sp.]
MSSHEFADLHSLAGAYALDAVDDVERAEFERHLVDCEQCREEVAGFRATATQLSTLMRATPPERLREQVLGDIAKVRPLPPAVRQEAGDRIEATSRERAAAEPASRVARLDTTRHRRNRWLAAAAAVVVLGGGGALAVTQPWRSSQVQNDIAAQVQQAPDAQRYQQTLPDGSTVTIVRSPSVGRAVLVTQNLATPPSGQTYQMWLQAPAGNFVSAGLVPPGANETVLQGDAATATGAGVSVEPSGGSQQPTTTPIALFAFT